jgi:hypothetical protein
VVATRACRITRSCRPSNAHCPQHSASSPSAASPQAIQSCGIMSNRLRRVSTVVVAGQPAHRNVIIVGAVFTAARSFENPRGAWCSDIVLSFTSSSFAFLFLLLRLLLPYRGGASESWIARGSPRRSPRGFRVETSHAGNGDHRVWGSSPLMRRCIRARAASVGRASKEQDISRACTGRPRPSGSSVARLAHPSCGLGLGRRTFPPKRLLLLGLGRDAWR